MGGVGHLLANAIMAAWAVDREYVRIGMENDHPQRIAERPRVFPARPTFSTPPDAGDTRRWRCSLEPPEFNAAFFTRGIAAGTSGTRSDSNSQLSKSQLAELP